MLDKRAARPSHSRLRFSQAICGAGFSFSPVLQPGDVASFSFSPALQPGDVARPSHSRLYFSQAMWRGLLILACALARRCGGSFFARETVSTVSLVAPLKAVLLNEDFEFFGKVPPSMMFFLTSNVVSHFVDVRVRNRESSIPASPSKPAFDQMVLIDPM